jgi:hypothetical protein
MARELTVEAIPFKQGGVKQLFKAEWTPTHGVPWGLPTTSWHGAPFNTDPFDVVVVRAHAHTKVDFEHGASFFCCLFLTVVLSNEHPRTCACACTWRLQPTTHVDKHATF